MPDYGNLPFTGAGVGVGGVLFDQLWLLVLAAVLIGAGVLAIRYSFRPGKTPLDL